MTCYIGQGFGENMNPSYKDGGLKGHSGVDQNCGFGSPIYSQHSGIAYKVLTKSHPANDGTGFTGVFMIVDDGIECFEWLVGHCDPVVTEGQKIEKGELIGFEANHGTVFSGNMQITLAMQQAGDTRGSHRHTQKRPVRPMRMAAGIMLSSFGNGNQPYRSPDGFYYQIIDFFNGYNGCVDPYAPVFLRDLWTGSEGYDVFVLQRALKHLGFFAHPECTGYFGIITIRAVRAFQSANSITPLLGYFGPKTRKHLSSIIWK